LEFIWDLELGIWNLVAAKGRLGKRHEVEKHRRRRIDDGGIFETIGKGRIIAVVRTETSQEAVDAATAVFNGGISVIEITATTDGWLRACGEVAKLDGVTLGVGSIYNSKMVPDAVNAGVDFIVSPGFTAKLSEKVSEAGMVYIPGAATPGEVMRCVERGYTVVKLFPARELGGPRYLKAILEPMPSVRLVPTGGIEAENAAEYLAAGAFAVGAGGGLVRKDLVKERRYSEIEALARRFKELVS
jgi:2-dehydro-3-deoxyphosphogluconate aldolase/(4S)-4-hydroxy-2-oxoglutarate aldolase